MKCPKCGAEMVNCCAEATKKNLVHSCGQSENHCLKCGYKETVELQLPKGIIKWDGTVIHG